MRLNQPPQESLFRWPWIFGFWALAAIFLTSSYGVTAWLTGRPMHWMTVSAYNAICCLLWALATPLVVSLSRRFAIAGPGWRSALLVHLLFSIAFVVAILALFVGLDALLKVTGSAGDLVAEFKELLHQLLNAEILYYWFIVILHQALVKSHSSHLAQLQVSAMAENLAKVRLRTLTQQIQPHFLFNTLNTLASLVRLNRKGEAVAAIAEFGELMRASLKQSDRIWHSVGAECTFLRNYLLLESRRHEDAVFDMQIDPACEEYLIPSFLLQPIVENAIRHGVRGRKMGLLYLKIGIKNQRLEISVFDNGKGFPVGWSIEECGVGLRNVSERLRVHYGRDASLQFQSNSAGCRVQLRIPATREAP